MKVLLVSFVCCLLLPALRSAAADDYLPYADFIAAVESGVVSSVTLDQFSQITGTYTVDGSERPFTTFADTGSANDILLTRLLKENSVAVTAREQPGRPELFARAGMVGILLLSALPLIIQIITLIFAFLINSKLNRRIKMQPPLLK